MAERTEIAWCDSTFNPWIGCTKVGPGCDNCYAKADFEDRKHRVVWGAGHERSRTSPANWKKPMQWNATPFCECPDCGWRGEWREADQRCGACPACKQIPPRFKPARRRVFCASLADVFDNEVPQQWRYDLFNLILSTPSLDWLLLTKRIGNAAKMIDATLPENLKSLPADHPIAWPWPNVWLGASIVNQAEADRDIPKLLATPAAVRFLSMEPLLGPVTLAMHGHRVGVEGSALRGVIDWVIVGGESGPHARPMRPDWARSLRDQCAAAGVPFLFKQWGEFLAENADADDPRLPDVSESLLYWSDGEKWDRFDGQRAGVDLVARVGKKSAGRRLDGLEHNQFPDLA